MRRFIEAYGESRFDPIPAQTDVRPVHNRAGWRRGHDEVREWLVLPEAWKEISLSFFAMDSFSSAFTLSVSDEPYLFRMFFRSVSGEASKVPWR